MPWGVYKRNSVRIDKITGELITIKWGLPKGYKFSKESLERRKKTREGKIFTRGIHKYINGQVILRNNRYYVVDYFRRDRSQFVPRAVLVMEQYLGRKLIKGEIVHHINRIKTDDRIENLKLFSSVGEHTKEHHNILGHKTPKPFVYKPRVLKVPERFLGI